MNSFQSKINQNVRERDRADAYRGLTYLQLNTDKGTQEIIRGGGGEKSRLAHPRVVVREVKTS